MSSRTYTIAFISLAILGIGFWWLQPKKDSSEGEAPYALADSRSYIDKARPASAIPASPVIAENKSSKSSTDAVPISHALPVSAMWSAKTLEFAEQADSDPILSREIEYVIQRSVDSTLDRSRYDVHSIKCRGQSCQVLVVDRAPVAGTAKGWPQIVGEVLRGLHDAAIRAPATGAKLGRPMLQGIEHIGGEPVRFITLIGFEIP
jgi:hypothetical protein